MELSTYLSLNMTEVTEECARVLAGLDASDFAAEREEAGTLRLGAGFDLCDVWTYLPEEERNRYRVEAAARIGSVREAARRETLDPVPEDKLTPGDVGADLAHSSCGSGGGSGYLDLPDARAFSESPGFREDVYGGQTGDALRCALGG